MATVFETQTCGRCGGGGQYSYCQMYGTMCFGCSGSGVVYTKKGLAAKNYFEASCSKPAGEFKVGEVIKGGNGLPFAKILSINPNGVQRSRTNDGPWIETPMIVIETNKVTLHTTANAIYRQGQSNEDKAAKIAVAVAYQATLTKMGKPMKRLARVAI